MILKKTSFVILASFLICSCTDNGFLFRSSGNYQKNEQKSIIYKIGNPYQINGTTYTPAEDYSYTAQGEAGWYMADQNHLITANGERYDSNKLTAIHKTLPLPSIVRVTNLNNGRTAIVRINDRGPFENERIMDVSEKAAEELNFTETGTTPVKIEIMPYESKQLKEQLLKNAKMGESFYSDESDSANDIIYSPKLSTSNKADYYIQLGVFSQPSAIQKIKNNLYDYTNIVTTKIERNNQLLYRVRVGPFETYETAMKGLDKIHQAGYGESIIISE